MKKITLYTLIVGFSVFFLSCQSDSSVKEIVKEKVVLPAPFKKLDRIEVKPGLSFDVLNWGKGPDSLSSILILRSDTVKNSHTAYNLEIEGLYKEVFNTDMDTDGNPELIIYTTESKKYAPANIYCLEYNGAEPSRIRFPDLTEKTKKQYRGNDKFYIHSGKLRREFELFENPDDQNAKPVEKKVVEYQLRRNQFEIKEVKE